MNSNNPFGTRSAETIANFYRQSRMQADIVSGMSNHGANIQRLLDQTSFASQVLRDLRKDPFRDTISALTKRARDMDGMSATMRAIEDAQRHRDLTVKALAGGDLFRQRKLAIEALDTGILRTAEIFARNQSAIAAAVAGTRRYDEMTGLASSIVNRMDALRLGGFGRDSVPGSLAEQFAKEYATAREAAERFEAAETDEERAALLMTLLTAIVGILRGIAGNTKKEFMGIGLVMLFSLSADVNSLISRDALPGMTPAQVQMLEETHRTTETLQRELEQYLESVHRLDEAYVSNLPRAELARAATIRVEPERHGKALWRAPVGTLLAIAKVKGKWKLATYRDPLTDELAQGWVYGSTVTMLDD